ncbi:hypothetical protein [Paraburkholderia sp. C35]|uniref:hypothetical protein n=1 Tax=Paraburkholderia sp. C35 TaxID=2126993 RepID=UPI000D690582|nr:hypothetical protein [Paraburkholderia sp. C35]
MKKSYIAAALVAVAAAAGFAVTANASLFSDPKPAPAPFTLKSVDFGHNATTFLGKAETSNPLAYDPFSNSLMGLRLGDSLPAACPVVLDKPCAAQSSAHGAIVAGLSDHLGLGSDLVADHEGAGPVEGQALVGLDASGRIDAIVVPMWGGSGEGNVARTALKAFAWRFGDPSSISSTQVVWNLPNGVHATVVYKDTPPVPWHVSHTTRVKMLYAAIYTDGGASQVEPLQFTEWSRSSK